MTKTKTISLFSFLPIILLTLILDNSYAQSDKDNTVEDTSYLFPSDFELMQTYKSNSKSAIDALIEGLKNNDSTIRSNAAFALGEIGREAEPSLKELAKVLKKDPDIEVRRNAAFALGEIGSPSISILIESMNDIDPRVRRSVFAALVRIGAPAVPALIKSLEDPDSMIRINAAGILGRIGHRAKDAVPVLEKQLNSTDEAFVWTVKEALRKIKLVTVDDLIQSLNDKDVIVRINAAASLAEMGDNALTAIPYLIECLSDEKAEMRKTSSDTIISYEEKALPYLIEALSSSAPRIRRNAAYCLGEIGKPAESAIPELKKLLKDSDQQVTWVADNAIKNIKASLSENILSD